MGDYDNEDGTGPKNEEANLHWAMNPRSQKGVDDAWLKTDIRESIDKKNREILDNANGWDYTHYLYDIDDSNFDKEMLVFTSGEELSDGRKREDVESVTMEDMGFTKDFYHRFRKEQRVPVWQDLKMGGDFDGDGEIDDISKASDIQAHTAWFEGLDGQKWAFKLKGELEWAMQFMEDLYSGKEIISKENANRYNEFIEIMWSAYPEHFEGKKRPHVAIEHAQGETDPILDAKKARVASRGDVTMGNPWLKSEKDKYVKNKQYYYFTVN